MSAKVKQTEWELREELSGPAVSIKAVGMDWEGVGQMLFCSE